MVGGGGQWCVGGGGTSVNSQAGTHKQRRGQHPSLALQGGGRQGGQMRLAVGQAHGATLTCAMNYIMACCVLHTTCFTDSAALSS
jgi:hypothetical protein